MPSVVRWREGNSQVLIQALPPVRDGIVHIPKAGTGGAGMHPNIWFQIEADNDIRLPIAGFDGGSNFLDFRFLDVPEGSHLYCLDDITLEDELDFLEFQVPPGTPGDVWFNAIADEPDLEYKDQLPLHAIDSGSRVGEFTKVLEAWNGNGGTSCLGDAPDILDIVRFMNDGLKCP